MDRFEGKRKETRDSCPRKRRAVVAEEAPDWTSLHPDITNLIAERLLADDVTEYMRFRAVCSHWRASTASPRDGTLADRRFHPRGWVALCDGNGIRPVEAAAITFFNTSTSRIYRLRLPELQGHRIVGFTDGLVILLDTRTAVIRVLHPFTRVVVELPSLDIFFRYMLSEHESFSMDSFIWMNATVCVPNPNSSIAVVIWFPNVPMVISAQPGDDDGWKLIHIYIQLSNTLQFNGVLYGVTQMNRYLVRLYPRDPEVHPVVAEVPEEFDFLHRYFYYLVESMGAMFIIVLDIITGGYSGSRACALFKVDPSRRELSRVHSLGDQALFIGGDRCLSVSAKDLASISGNSIYLAIRGQNPVEVCSLDDGSFESTTPPRRQANEIMAAGAIPASVRPFTIADHLATYCHHREWTRGLMFHEYCYIPSFCSELLERIAAQDSEVAVPTIREIEGRMTAHELGTFLLARTRPLRLRPVVFT